MDRERNKQTFLSIGLATKDFIKDPLARSHLKTRENGVM